MTFYKNLGPITFEYETQQLQVFSGSHSTLLFQFKHYPNVDIDSLASLMTVYEFMLKDEHLLELYTQKNKPVSILLHKATPVSFQHINIQLLCQIIKQMATSIFQTRKINQNKIGEITKQMFFSIDDNLRYLYFPIRDCSYKQEEMVSQMVQFFNSLKDDKDVSQRLLLKKISKCVSIESVIEETDYFMSVYHSKQVAMGMKQSAATSQQSFFIKTIKNPYFNQPNMRSQIPKNKGFNTFDRTKQLSNSKNSSRRKLNLFKDTENKSFRNTNSSSHYNLSTWRSGDNQNSFFRNTTKALHLDSTQRSTKNQSNSLFQKANSTVQSQQRLSHRKLFTSTHIKNQNYVSSQNQPVMRQNSRQNSKHQQKKKSGVFGQSSGYRQSGISQNVDESITSSKQMIESQNLKNTSSSQWLKQKVNNSLEKWKQKSKINIFSRIKHQDKQRSILVDSRAKIIIQKVDKTPFEGMKNNFYEEEVSCFLKNENFNSSTQSTNFTPAQSQIKTNKLAYNNYSTFIETPKQEFKKQNILSKNSSEFEFQFNKNFINQQQKLQQTILTQKFQESLEQINLNQSSIQQITLKNKQQQLKQNQKIETKKSSVKEIPSKKVVEINTFVQKQKQLQIAKQPKNLKKTNKKNEIIEKQPQKDTKILKFQDKLKQNILQKEQIDFIGVAVAQTAEHLKSFQSIFWQLPMFFLYKKFYEKRLELSKSINELLTDLNSQKQKSLQQITAQVRKNSQQISEQNENIEQSLKKLLKIVKKKIKKQYPRKQEQQYVEKNLHLDFTIQYDQVADQFISMYIQSLLEAKSQFPELVFHIIDIFEAVSVCKGQFVDVKLKQSFDPHNKQNQNIQKAEKYFNTLSKKRQIKVLLQPEQKKTKGKK